MKRSFLDKVRLMAGIELPKTKKLKNDLVVAKAQKQHKKRYGKTMSPSQLRQEASFGGKMSEESQSYIKNKKQKKKQVEKMYNWKK